MKFNTLLYEKDKEVPQIVYVTLNRPEKSNVISMGHGNMTQELQDAMRMVTEDDDVKVAIIRAAGKNFCAGEDLEMVYRIYGGSPTFRPYQGKRLVVDDTQLYGQWRAVFLCDKITIAQVHGWCIEGGMDIVEGCDIAVAADNSKFAHRGQRIAFGGIPMNPLEILRNPKKIRELMLTGRTISGKEAEDVGKITKAVPEADLASEVYNLAKAICVIPYDAIVMGKMACRHHYNQANVIGMDTGVVYHTLATNLRYKENEKELRFIVGREKEGSAREAFHKHHAIFEEALNKTKYFRSYTG